MSSHPFLALEVSLVVALTWFVYSLTHSAVALGWLMLSFTLGGVIGPVLAGLLIGWLSAPNVILIDMLSYFTYAFLLSRVTLEPAQPTTPGQAPYHLGPAVQLLLGNPILLSTTLMFLVFNIGVRALRHDRVQ